jgi:uncharacterized membrane protein
MGYNKLIVAAVGALVSFAIGVAQQHGLDLSGNTQVITDLIIGALTAWGVYQVANKTDNTTTNTPKKEGP